MAEASRSFQPVPTPSRGIDPRVALATALHAAPGVYAVLVGSGMSSAAGIPTGWRVVQDLIRKVARAELVGEDELGGSPEKWWEAQGRGEPSYSTLLDDLAPTPAARQALLRSYFDPPPPQRPVQPTDGHRALAALCAEQRVRVVLTTNFDRLIERALENAGASAQVITTVDDINGMTPLQHARTTVIKVHGDYESSDMRNTHVELAAYPPPLRALLGRVLDDYGLLVVGWSAEHDAALAQAISACPSRRYPAYWATHNGHLTETAKRLISTRDAAVIDTAGADEFFSDLVERVSSLNRRAARRESPSVERIYRHPPQRGASEGWRTIPLLQLRTVAELGPAALDQCQLIRPQDRERLLEALRRATVNNTLSVPSAMTPAFVQDVSEESAPSRVSTAYWDHTPGAHQSADYISCRWGGDGTTSVSALATASVSSAPQSGVALCALDIGISAQEMLWTAPVSVDTFDSCLRDAT